MKNLYCSNLSVLFLVKSFDIQFQNKTYVVVKCSELSQYIFGKQDLHSMVATNVAFYLDKSRQDSDLASFTSRGSPGFNNCESTGKFYQYNS